MISQLIKNIKKSMINNDFFWRIKEEDFRCTQDGKPFVQCNHAFTDEKGKSQRIVILGHETLMNKTRGRKYHFYDGTFRVTP